MSYPIDNSMAGLGFGSDVITLSGSMNSGGMSPVTISSIGNISMREHNSLFGLNSSKHTKKYEVTESDEDILVLSAVWYRMRKKNSNPFPRPQSLTDNILFEFIEPEDRELATTIRGYYSKKIMMFTLREQKLTSFRKDLNSFIHSDGKIFKETIAPLVYRLPEFYEYDIGFDDLSFNANKQFSIPKSNISNSRLTPLAKLIVKKRNNKCIEYWLKDDENRLAKIEIPLDNQLTHLWNHYFDEDSIPIIGNFRYKERDNVNYFHIKNWEIDFTSL